MTEQVAENYPVREILPDKEMVEISDVPQIIQWPNGRNPWTIFHLKNNNAYWPKPCMPVAIYLNHF